MHPVDRLHDIRIELASLRQEATAIRQRILTGEISREGATFKARVRTQVTLHDRLNGDGHRVPVNGGSATWWHEAQNQND